MRLLTSSKAMQRQTAQWRGRDARVAFVPTMGYLHEGHLSLVRAARRFAGRNGKVVVSIYVNPTQFGPKEDLSRYPRNLKRDLKLCRAEGVDLVFAPTDAEMYPGKGAGLYSTYVVEEQLGRQMEGASRPTHFRGVTTVVAKLFNLVQPHVAVFGAKDWQQAAIVKRMVADLNLPVKIVVLATVREPDGLALSSRNKFLAAAQRVQATILHRAILRARQMVKSRSVSAARLKADLKKFIASASLARLDYVECFNPDTLEPVQTVRRGTHLALAVYFGQTRLIDNGRL